MRFVLDIPLTEEERSAFVTRVNDSRHRIMSLRHEDSEKFARPFAQLAESAATGGKPSFEVDGLTRDDKEKLFRLIGHAAERSNVVERGPVGKLHTSWELYVYGRGGRPDPNAHLTSGDPDVPARSRRGWRPAWL